jgi:rod shape-determining protein MreC
MITRKNIIILVSLTAAVAAVLFFQIFKQTILKVASRFYHPFIAPVTIAENNSIKDSLATKSRSELIDEIIKLKKNNERKQAQIRVFTSLKSDKKRLEELLTIKPVPGYKCVFAEIYIRDPAFWYESFSINKGADDGIKPGAVVLSKIEQSDNSSYTFAVLGRVSNVERHLSQVQTIVSQTCKLSVIVEGAEAAGILQGGTIDNAKPYVKIAYLPVFKKYTKNADVLTSGLCRNRTSNLKQYSTPAGLFIGKIAGKVKTVNNLSAEAEVRSAIDFDSLKYVIVLVEESGIIQTN